MQTSAEDPVDVSRSLAALALVILPLAGCTSSPAQADPALETPTVVSAQPEQPAAAPTPPANDVPEVPAPLITSLDVEDGATLTVADRNAIVVYSEEDPDIGTGAARHALKQVGTPYVWGGNTPRGFDCSGLIQYSYALAGLDLPRVTIKQRSASRAVPRKQLQPGDLLFFHIDGKRYSHIGIYIGEGQFVHAPRTGKFVSTASLSNPYWQKNFGGARRPRALFYEVSSLDSVRTER